MVYSETFLSPDFCGGGDLHAWQDYLNAIQDAADEAERKYRILPCAASSLACVTSDPNKARQTQRVLCS